MPILHQPNMEIPISNSLNLVNKLDINFKNIEINISSPNLNKFPIIKLGFKILKMDSHSAMILFTVLNETIPFHGEENFGHRIFVYYYFLKEGFVERYRFKD